MSKNTSGCGILGAFPVAWVRSTTVLLSLGGVLVLGAGFCAPAFAQPAATVRLLQAPAWLERDGQRQPLRRGAMLQSADRVVTGPQARVLLRLAEGSHVKLGAEASLTLESLQPPADADGVFEGVLDIVRGAFRFTTTLVDRKRDIRARLRSATIGIRGTDVWGKAEDARDFVVLLEGSVSIERDGTTTTLDTPLSLFMAPRGAPALPVGPVDNDDLGRWAQETEPQAGQGVIDAEGEWRANLASYRDADAADRLRAQLGASGYAADVEIVEVAGVGWHRVVLSGYASREDVAHALAALAASHSLSSPWISRGS